MQKLASYVERFTQTDNWVFWVFVYLACYIKGFPMDFLNVEATYRDLNPFLNYNMFISVCKVRLFTLEPVFLVFLSLYK